MYDKYKKVKSDNPNKSISNVSRYINDDEKTIYSTKKAIDYIANEAKTYEAESNIRLVSGYNCDPETAVDEFEIVRNNYYSVKDEHLNAGQTPIQAYHFISSFKGKVDPELAHKIGIEFCQVLLGDSFQAVVSTHLNTNNTHNHILVNAYALDGAYKFKDEYHLYEKLRSISNDLSLKYGIPVYMGDEKTRQSYKSWATILDKDALMTQKNQFKADIEEAAALTSDYKSFLDYMSKKGYSYIQNKNSTTFKNADASFRDTTLGTAYTKASLQKKWAEDKKSLEKQKAYQKLQELRQKNALKFKKYNPPLIKKWDEFGNRLGFLERLLLAIKNLISQISDDYYSPELEELYPSNINFQSPIKKLARIDKALDYLKSHQILTEAGLQDAITQAGLNMSLIKSDLTSTQSFLSNAEELVQNLQRLQQVESLLSSANFPLSSIPFISPSKEEVRKNLTSLQPMTAKTKSRLYQKMHESTYRLSIPFNQISELEAKEILYFLTSEDEGKQRPQILLTKEEYYSDLSKKDLQILLNGYPCVQTMPSIQPYYAKQNRATNDQFRLMCMIKKAFPDVFDFNPSFISQTTASEIISYAASLVQAPPEPAPLKPIDLSIFSPELQSLIKEYRLLKSEALDYGLDSQEKIDNFLSNYNDQLIDLQKLKDDLQSATTDYKDLKFVQRVIQDCQKTSYVYGPTYNGNSEELNVTKADLGSQKLDRLFEVHKTLVRVIKDIDMSSLSSAPISSPSFAPPTPEVKCVLSELKNITKASINIDTISEYDAFDFIKSVIQKHELELEMKRQLEQEQQMESEEEKAKNSEAFEKFLNQKSHP